jgi:hypothetical protein
MFPYKVVVDTDGKDLERLGVVRMPPVEPYRLTQLKIDAPESVLKEYEDQKNILFQTEKKKYIDRNLVPKKIILETEISQEELSIPEKTVNLDAVIAVNVEIKESEPVVVLSQQQTLSEDGGTETVISQIVMPDEKGGVDLGSQPEAVLRALLPKKTQPVSPTKAKKAKSTFMSQLDKIKKISKKD